MFHLQNFSSLSQVPCLSRSFKRPGFPGLPRVSNKTATDPGQVSRSFLQTNFRASTSALPAISRKFIAARMCLSLVAVPHLKVVGRNSCFFEAFFVGARFPCKMLHEQL